MCCTESYCIFWEKGVKYASPRVKGFLRYLCWNSTASKGYLVYVPHRRKIISSYDVVFDEIFSNELAYTSHHYPRAMAMHQTAMYTPCATYLRRKTDDIITFVQFEEGNILTNNRNDAESGEKSNDD